MLLKRPASKKPHPKADNASGSLLGKLIRSVFGISPSAGSTNGKDLTKAVANIASKTKNNK